ncbi:MAG: twin-arginine translocase subunit TatB [Gammaproteobacteria bacterium]|nr:twin-arginine translocase subunit TatB [Gammaproteobacteria bacterium]
MFDISFSELLVVLMVALVVLGPEKLHGIVRTVGRWSGKARVYLNNLTAELERETQAAELKKQFTDAHRILREGADSTRAAAQEAAAAVKPDQPPADTPAASGEAESGQDRAGH